MIERIAQTTHVVSTFWVLVLAAIVLVDVLGRYFFGQPLLGATEVLGAPQLRDGTQIIDLGLVCLWQTSETKCFNIL